MNILICTNSLGARGGIEKVTILKANALAEVPGNRVSVCFTDRGTFPQSTIHPVSPKVNVYDLGVTFWDLSPINLRNLLVRAPKKFLRLRKSLQRLISELNADVVITFIIFEYLKNNYVNTHSFYAGL